MFGYSTCIVLSGGLTVFFIFWCCNQQATLKLCKICVRQTNFLKAVVRWCTAWKVSKYRVFLVRIFLYSEVNREIHFANLRIQYEYRKYWQERTPHWTLFPQWLFRIIIPSPVLIKWKGESHNFYSFQQQTSGAILQKRYS